MLYIHVDVAATYNTFLIIWIIGCTSEKREFGMTCEPDLNYLSCLLPGLRMSTGLGGWTGGFNCNYIWQEPGWRLQDHVTAPESKVQCTLPSHRWHAYSRHMTPGFTPCYVWGKT